MKKAGGILTSQGNMSQSPELAAGEGFTFEASAATYFLVSLLAESHAPGISDRIVSRVSLQQRDFGEPLDDIIVDFTPLSANNEARLSLQAKQSITISDAVTNSDFREIITDSWKTLLKPDFRESVDRFGAIVETVAAAKEKDLKRLCDFARESLTAAHFEQRFSADGNASAEVQSIRDSVTSLLNEAKGSACTSEEVHRFLSHFVFIRIDVLREGATNRSEALNQLESCLSESGSNQNNSSLAWSRLHEIARLSAGRSGQFDRNRLARELSPALDLQPSTRFKETFAVLSSLAASQAGLIETTIRGIELPREKLQQEFEEKLKTNRFVQVTGLPGCGKSALIKNSVVRNLNNGPVLFLKAEQVTATSWINYASQHNLNATSIEDLLVELSLIGTPILYLDALDRLPKKNRPVVLDLISTILGSSELKDWKVVISLRDSGIELLHTWLDDALRSEPTGNVLVGPIDDEDVEFLAESIPHLKPLLYGSSQIRAVARRPFFAKILAANDIAEGSFAPSSELELIQQWWKRGGYDSQESSALERQRSLSLLASKQARRLSKAVRLVDLDPSSTISDLISDNIVQEIRAGVSLRFSHDIFFEWSYLHSLIGADEDWVSEIRECGEPPALARVVELLSQLYFQEENKWSNHITQLQDSALRSQWIRAWLFGPFQSPLLPKKQEALCLAIFSNDYELLGKLLVWFQAEKTTPNTNLLQADLPQNERQQYAYLFGHISDYRAWSGFLDFVFSQMEGLPLWILPKIILAFEVWQNTLGGFKNRISTQFVGKCAFFLTEIDSVTDGAGAKSASYNWAELTEIKEFRKKLRTIVLQSAVADVTFASRHIDQLLEDENLRKKVFEDVLKVSLPLAQALPQKFVELILLHLKRDLPEIRRARARERGDDSFLSYGNFEFELDKLCIEDDYRSFYPTSPLREPFNSLFKMNPGEGLRLVRELCNHATLAWRQTHRLSPQEGSPLPLELNFPWGRQIFWGGEREYRWFRGCFGPNAVVCGLMALEDWCFSELDQGQSLDELLEKIVASNHSVAILGVASTLALATEHVSTETLPLFTSQRLLNADQKRRMEDISSMHANLICFSGSMDPSQIESVRKLNKRPARQQQTSWMIPLFTLRGDEISKKAQTLLRNLPKNLQFEYEEQKKDTGARQELIKQAKRFAELAEPSNYSLQKDTTQPDKVAIIHNSPSASEPQVIVDAEAAQQRLTESSLGAWASMSLESGEVGELYTIAQAFTLAEKISIEEPQDQIDSIRGDLASENRTSAIAGTAAMAMSFRDGLADEELDWARNVLNKILREPEERSSFGSPFSLDSTHPFLFAARGFGADLAFQTNRTAAAENLIHLVVHPLECVSIAALQESLKVSELNPRLAWTSLKTALSLLHVPPPPEGINRAPNTPLHDFETLRSTVETALADYQSNNEWSTLPSPPQAWIKSENTQISESQLAELDEYDDIPENWVSPPGFWNHQKAEKILTTVAIEKLAQTPAKAALIEFLGSLVEWTNDKNSPPWKEAQNYHRAPAKFMSWTRALGRKVGVLAPCLTIEELQEHFLDRIFKLEGELCWALLSPFTDSFVCGSVFDSATMPSDAVRILDLCLDRFLEHSAFKEDCNSRHLRWDLDDSRLVESLMFVSVEKASLAARFVNGDWSEIELVLPLIDRLIRAGFRQPRVVSAFLTLCERAREHYPTNLFVEQTQVILEGFENRQLGMEKHLVPSRIAELINFFTDRDTPLEQETAQGLLRILDGLIDCGDRRAAALQLSEAFRETRLS